LLDPRSFELFSVAEAICVESNLVLTRPLGRGSYKQAYLVEDGEGNQFALKIINDPNPSPRLQREIESLIRCKHPSIARLIYVGLHSYEGTQYHYLLEEYLSGGTLSERISASGGLSVTEISQFAVSLIDALAYLEKLGLVHRDIKPDNIMFRGDLGTPVLVDFGCVRDLSAASLTQTWYPSGPGTPYFSSPEQLTNKKQLTNWRSDQFSLGVTLFFAKYQGHPYQFPDEDLYAIETVQRVASFEERRPDLSLLLNTSALQPIKTMTAPWPVQRYAKPSDLIAAWNEKVGN
jgi:serine/threonine protein kinase